MTEYHGRIAITWPAPASAGLVMGWGVTIHDADSGEQILDATSLNIAHGAPEDWDGGPLYATVTRLLGHDGQPSNPGHGRAPAIAPTDEYAKHLRAEADANAVLPFEGQRYRVGTFRYLIAEMRTVPPPANPS